MRVLIFDKHKKAKEREPIIIYDVEWNIPRRTILSLLLIILTMVLIGVSLRNKPVQETPTYSVCDEKPSMMYRDETDGKMRVLGGYKACESTPMQGTGNRYGSCIDSGCNFAESQEQIYERRIKEIGLIHFTR